MTADKMYRRPLRSGNLPRKRTRIGYQLHGYFTSIWLIHRGSFPILQPILHCSIGQLNMIFLYSIAVIVWRPLLPVLYSAGKGIGPRIVLNDKKSL